MSGADQARETIRAFWNVMFQERDPQLSLDLCESIVDPQSLLQSRQFSLE